MTRPITISKLQTGNADLDRVQEHLREKLNPVLASLPSAADFRWMQLPGTDATVADTWALQFRTTGTTWTTIVTFTSAGQIAQSAWTAPTLLNSWVNLGGGTQPAGYYKDSLGIIHLRGAVTGGVGNAIFTLPTGFRPAADSFFAVDVGGAYGRIKVGSNGSVQRDVGGAGAALMDGINFDTRS